MPDTTPSSTSQQASHWTASATRQSFLDFFASKDHTVVPSGPVFPQDDPTLLFTNAGMNQFKDVFLGSGSRGYTRAVNSQKCIRVQGKHNDLEEVGVDTYHHTFFEMLGNWSFGDYFKADAITWAWELLTEVWGLPKERLWVTVFDGDAYEGVDPDFDARRLWQESTDIDHSHILDFDKDDNFWEMGPTGPCGPCSEIHIDRGGPETDPADGADRDNGVNAGNERFIELWNLVFIQYNRQDDGSLVPLPAKHVDTGMGFERILSVLQGCDSNYDTDLFTPLFAELSRLTGHEYGGGSGSDEKDVAFRVCADHVRAVSSALADGALPSNEGRGYVLRRLIRRASRYGLQTLGMEDPFLFELVPAAAAILGDAFPEVAERVEHIQLVVRAEEESFRKTLQRGIVQFERLTADLSSGSPLDGGQAYELYATYGFPEDLVSLMARERDLVLDVEGWETARKAHSDISRSTGSFQQVLTPEQMSGLEETHTTYHDEGPASTGGEACVTGLFQGGQLDDRLVLDQSPFYPEGGGQVGDAGVISNQGGSFQVTATQKAGAIVVHLGKATGSLSVGETVTCEVDARGRQGTRAHHTATHLLHAALRQVLGEHVTQQGSYVGPDRLRFDFSSPKGVTAEELAQVERLVNAAVARGATVATTIEKPEEAKARGVMALFGEKYGETVRVVAVGDDSVELCGGTHVENSGQIGAFLIQQERAIQAGVRRIEAVVGSGAIEHMQEQRRCLEAASQTLKVQPSELSERVAALQADVKAARKQAKQSSGVDQAQAFASLKQELDDAAGVDWAVVDLPELDGDALRDLGDRARGHSPDLALALFGRQDQAVPFLILCQGKALDAGLAAGDLARGLKPVLGGGGGGKPTSAQGQGMAPDQVSVACDQLRAAFNAALGS
jgi:alanyl-tRNA synthetase